MLIEFRGSPPSGEPIKSRVEVHVDMALHQLQAAEFTTTEALDFLGKLSCAVQTRIGAHLASVPVDFGAALPAAEVQPPQRLGRPMGGEQRG